MSAQYDADACVAVSPPKRLRKRYRRDVRTLADLDGRTAPARRARDLAARLRADLGSDPTAAQAELITRCTMLSVLAGDCEVKVMRNQPVDIHAYVALVNCQRRALSVLGVAPDPKLIDASANRVTNPELARRLANTWPEFHEQEIARHARDTDHMAAQIAALGDDELESDELPAQEE
jgi:hypothetical protein